MHLIVTDSGLGGLSICAEIERALRERGRGARITFVNAWPEDGRGYNELPDMPARARELDRALDAMATLGPDRILIACNTLSIVYPHTRFHARPATGVHEIVAAGVEVFASALSGVPSSAIVLVGTRTTIDSGVHRARLVERGISAARIGAASCHGLATAIERGPMSADTTRLIASCAAAAAGVAPSGEPLYLGLCCTHYGMVANRLAVALAERVSRTVQPLDPNPAVARAVVSELDHVADGTGVHVQVLSRVALSDAQRDGVAAMLDPISPETAEALRKWEQT